MQLANVAHSYSIIQAAAADAAKEEPWCNDAQVRSLKFSDKWVLGFMRRWQLRRRKITALEKARPSIADVRTRLSAIQLVIESKKLIADDAINADETGINRQSWFEPHARLRAGRSGTRRCARQRREGALHKHGGGHRGWQHAAAV